MWAIVPFVTTKIQVTYIFTLVTFSHTVNWDFLVLVRLHWPKDSFVQKLLIYICNLYPQMFVLSCLKMFVWKYYPNISATKKDYFTKF